MHGTELVNQRAGLTYERSHTSTSPTHKRVADLAMGQVRHCHRNMYLSHVVPFTLTTATINPSAVCL